MEYIGIDVHKISSQVCIFQGEEKYRELRISTARESFAKHFEGMTRSRIVIEASTESEWVAQCLEGFGHEVIVADPNFAPMYATRSRRIKTDRRDARALCDATRLGAYRPAHRPPGQRMHERAQLRVRQALVSTRSRYISLIGALVRREGYRLLPGSSASFTARLWKVHLPRHLEDEMEPLVAALKVIDEQIKLADRRLADEVKDNEVVKRLVTAPGVGPVTAVTFVALVDRVDRFSTARQLRAYLGVVPREMSSGERQQRGHITKAGNGRMRSLLVEAAWTVMRSRRIDAQPLRAWAEAIAKRRGKRIAAVALARKLAGVLFAMWRDGVDFTGTLSNQEKKSMAA